MHYGDMTDATSLIRLIQETQPTEIYNLAAQSHVQVSFETPEYSADADGLGTLRLLEALRKSGYVNPVTAGSTDEKVRRLIRRLNITSRDVPVVLGMLRQILWKLGE